VHVKGRVYTHDHFARAADNLHAPGSLHVSSFPKAGVIACSTAWELDITVRSQFGEILLGHAPAVGVFDNLEVDHLEAVRSSKS
jgi:hypothetical protein